MFHTSALSCKDHEVSVWFVRLRSRDEKAERCSGSAAAGTPQAQQQLSTCETRCHRRRGFSALISSYLGLPNNFLVKNTLLVAYTFETRATTGESKLCFCIWAGIVALQSTPGLSWQLETSWLNDLEKIMGNCGSWSNNCISASPSVRPLTHSFRVT